MSAPSRLHELAEAWGQAAAEQQRVHNEQAGQLGHGVALVARGRARQLEDCAAELVAALAKEGIA